MSELYFVHIASGCVLKYNFKLAMEMSLNALKNLPKEELSTMVLEYQIKFDNMLSNKLWNINTELYSQKNRFTKMKAQFLVKRRVNNNLLQQNCILEKKCAANEQHSMQECLETSRIPDSISN